MAKNLNSVSFSVLLVVLVMASTGFLKSEAQGLPCPSAPSTCPLATDRVFYDECPAAHSTTDAQCVSCCQTAYGCPVPVCWAVVEGTDRHCHCYKKKV